MGGFPNGSGSSDHRVFRLESIHWEMLRMKIASNIDAVQSVALRYDESDTMEADVKFFYKIYK